MAWVLLGDEPSNTHMAKPIDVIEAVIRIDKTFMFYKMIYANYADLDHIDLSAF